MSLPLMLPPAPADESFEKFAASVKHIACDRTDGEALKAALAGKGFQGEPAEQKEAGQQNGWLLFEEPGKHQG
jgi:hypothetical protein